MANYFGYGQNNQPNPFSSMSMMDLKNTGLTDPMARNAFATRGGQVLNYGITDPSTYQGTDRGGGYGGKTYGQAGGWAAPTPEEVQLAKWGQDQGLIRNNSSGMFSMQQLKPFLTVGGAALGGAALSGAFGGAGAAASGAGASAAPGAMSTGINLGGMGTTGAAASTAASTGGLWSPGVTAFGGGGLAGSGSGLINGIKNLATTGPFGPVGGAGGMMPMGNPSWLGLGMGGLDAIMRYRQGNQLEDIANQAGQMANPMNQPQRQQYQQQLSDYMSGRKNLMDDPMIKAAMEQGMKQTTANLARMGMTGSGNAGQEYINQANQVFQQSALPYLDWLSQMGGFNQGPGYSGNLYGQYASQATGAPFMTLDAIGKMMGMNSSPMLNTNSPYQGLFGTNRMYT